MTDTDITPDTDSTEEPKKAWIDPKTKEFADFTIAEQLLWEDNEVGSFGDIDIVFANLQKSQAMELIKEMSPEKIDGIRKRTWKLPTKITKYEDEVLLEAVRWLRLTDASYPEGSKLRLVDLVEATLSAMRFSIVSYDNMMWMAHMVYVIDQRDPDKENDWGGWKAQATSKDTEIKAAQIIVDYTAFTLSLRPQHRQRDDNKGGGEASPLLESSQPSEPQPSDTISIGSPSTSDWTGANSSS